MPHVLHITCDYPDSIVGNKTRAVANLVAHSEGMQHTVISLNRSVRPALDTIIDDPAGLVSMQYFGLPAGLGLKWSMRFARHRITQVIRRLKCAPDIIHAHKLTYEGQIAQVIATRLNIPFVVTVRGDTDFKLIHYKPTYRSLFRRILDDASGIIFVAPWARDQLLSLWPNLPQAGMTVLPNIVNFAPVARTAEPGRSSRFVSVFHLDAHKRKNIRNLIAAADLCIADGVDITLDIIGGGSRAAESAVRSIIRRSRFPNRYKMLGALDQRALADELPSYAAMVLPSRRETFGLVYLEALRSGVPIIHSQNAGIDGYFPDSDAVLAIDPQSPHSIAAAMRYINDNQIAIKASLANALDAGMLARFESAEIVHQYQRLIDRSIQRGPESAAGND